MKIYFDFKILCQKIYEKKFLKKYLLIKKLFIFVSYSNLLSVKKVLLLFVAIVFFHVYTAATTYYSIDDGNWSNTTTVWSLTSGGTPAGASPKKNDEVYIEGHAIILDVDMTATPGFGLDINATGSLTSSTTEGIMIKSASFFNIAGTLNVNSIDLQTSVKLIL